MPKGLLSKISLSLCCFLFSGELFAKTIIISDLDDTVRIRHVQEKIASGFKLLFRQQAFLGMAELYQVTLTASGEDSKIFYVTNSGQGDNQAEFLKNKSFPKGILYNREDKKNNLFKVQTISTIIEEEKPDRVILFGDNGEHDPEYYHRIMGQYSGQNIEFITFIRALYSLEDGRKIEAPQISFVTPLEPAIELAKHGILSIDQVRAIAALVLDGTKNPSMAQEMAYRKSDGKENKKTFNGKDRYFESWQNCEAFLWSWGSPEDLANLHPSMSVYFEYLKNRGCLN